jgi:DNA-binding CsgD family transcriptional regulator
MSRPKRSGTSLAKTFSAAAAEEASTSYVELPQEQSEVVITSSSPVLVLRRDGRFEISTAGTCQPKDNVTDDKGIQQTFWQCFRQSLTSTEVGIMWGLLAGLSIREISEADQVSYETRRNQLKAIMEKAGTSRQTDLIARMAAALAFSLKPATAGTRSAQTAPAAHLIA